MDGVLVHEGQALPGAADFLQRLVDRERRFLVLTNNSIFTPRDLAPGCSARAVRPEESIWTSALATADFLAAQLPGGSAYVIGEAGLTTACTRPATRSPTPSPTTWFSRDPHLQLRGHHPGHPLVEAGARFIATNPTPPAPRREGSLPATGRFAA